MKLKYSPYQIFKQSKSPAALYARKKWIGESESLEWKRDFKITVDKILDNGIWDDDNTASVVRKLFSLHLTVRDKTPEIEDALFRLIEKSEVFLTTMEESLISEPDLENLPFASGKNFIVIPAAALFLASIFGLSGTRAADKLFKNITSLSGSFTSPADSIVFSHNLFRALAVTPEYMFHPETERIIKMLIETQSEKGDWDGELPFYQAVNAAAHIKSEYSDIIINKALPSILSNQNRDGSWGEVKNREWNTFLTVHALKNRNLL